MPSEAKEALNRLRQEQSEARQMLEDLRGRSGQPTQQEQAQVEQFPGTSNVFGKSMLNKLGANLLQANIAAGKVAPVFSTPSTRALGGFAEEGVAKLQQQRNQLRLDSPFVTEAGEAVGDAVTLALIRSPVSKFITKGRINILREGKKVELPPGPKRALRRWFTGSRARTLAERLGRAGETGAEAGFIAALNDQDPLEATAYGSGSQLAGSLFTGGLSSVKGVLTLAGAAAGLTALLQLGKSALPGGSDQLIASGEQAFDKLKWGLALGVLGGAAGLGRLTGKSAEDFPIIADAITAIPRGTYLSMLNEITQGNPDIEPVLNTLSTQPQIFRPNVQVKLRKAMTEEGGDLALTIDKLKAEDPVFRERLKQIRGGLPQTPPRL